MKNVLITGGTGLIGTDISNYLKANGFTVKLLSRSKTQVTHGIYNWDINKGTMDSLALEDTDYIINLAGSSIIKGKWTTARKNEHFSSRIKTTELLVRKIKEQNVSIKHFIQASAMGYYGDQGDHIITENQECGTDYMAKLCQDWEHASSNLPPTTKRSVLRIGLYLSKNGGVYKSIADVSQYYLATAFGDGRMWANYTHKEEFGKLVLALFHEQLTADTYNAVGQTPFQMNELVRLIAHNEGRRVILPNIPSWLLKTMMGESSATLLNSYRISSPKLKNAEFYQFLNLKEALDAL